MKNDFTNYSHCKEASPSFTLDEVLITLGIIGVVAAMTMPSLIAAHRKHEVVTKLEKIYSVFNQAVRTSTVEHGDVTSWGIDCGNSNNVKCTTDEALERFNEYIGKYLQITSITKKDDNTGFYIFLNDGSILKIDNFLYDINFYINKKAINNPRQGINSFYFRFNPVLREGQSIENNKYAIKETFEPYAFGWDGTREGLLNTSNAMACGGIYSNYCGKLIQYEGWKIPDDYPYKF